MRLVRVRHSRRGRSSVAKKRIVVEKNLRTRSRRMFFFFKQVSKLLRRYRGTFNGSSKRTARLHTMRASSNNKKAEKAVAGDSGDRFAGACSRNNIDGDEGKKAHKEIKTR